MSRQEPHTGRKLLESRPSKGGVADPGVSAKSCMRCHLPAVSCGIPSALALLLGMPLLRSQDNTAWAASSFG